MPKKRDPSGKGWDGLSDSERKRASRSSSPSARVVYEAIRAEGVDELRRSSLALAFSALGAGLSMGFSLIAEGLLIAGLPDASWRPLITSLSYGVGFLMVILGRQQLFTENTLTPVLPLLHRPKVSVLLNVLRLWAVVLAANLLGALAFALILGSTRLFPDNVRAAFVSIGKQAMSSTFGLMFLKGIFAGWLIATILWLLPFAETARVGVIILVAYLVRLGDFRHSIAGSVEAFYLVAMGHASWGAYFGGFLVPVLLGNIVGGVALVAILNYAQVMAGEPRSDSE